MKKFEKLLIVLICLIIVFILGRIVYKKVFKKQIVTHPLSTLPGPGVVPLEGIVPMSVPPMGTQGASPPSTMAPGLTPEQVEKVKESAKGKKKVSVTLDEEGKVIKVDDEKIE